MKYAAYRFKIAALISILGWNYGNNALRAQECVPTESAVLETIHYRAPLSVNTIWNGPGYGSSPDPDAPALLGFAELLLGGFDPGGNLHVFQSSESGIVPGPTVPLLQEEICTYFDRFWRVTHTQIQDHVNDAADGLVDDPIPAIYEWPGRGNVDLPNFPTDFELAPFYDLNANGLYEPDLGEYPDIQPADYGFPLYPTEMVWWMFSNANDDDLIPVNIGCTAFHFDDRPDSILQRASFYQFNLTNRSVEDLDSLHFALALRPRLGCPKDDYFGVLPESIFEGRPVYFYNADAVDGNNENDCTENRPTFPETPPAVTVHFLQNFLNPIYNDSGHAIDTVRSPTPSITYGRMTPFGSTSPLAYPNSDVTFYNRLTGTWNDGSRQRFGGDGYQSSTETVAYPFTGDPSVAGSWSMLQEDLAPGDFRVYLSSFAGRLRPGQSRSAIVAVTSHLGPTYLPDLTQITATLQDLENLFYTGCLVNSFMDEPLPPVTTQLFPNPTNTLFTVKSAVPIRRVELYDTQGRLRRSQRDATVLVEDLPLGIYFVRVTGSDDSLWHGRVLVDHN